MPAKLGRYVEDSPARRLARKWGNHFGHKSAGEFYRTVGIMQQILDGDEEKGVPAYTLEEIETAIEALFQAHRNGLVEVRSPGFIKYVIADILSGEWNPSRGQRYVRVW